jgi:beta-N-acetylglucosaminidase
MKKSVSILLSGALLLGSLAGVVVSAHADTTDTAYIAQLREAGFPDSYLDSLAQLHEAYPDWQFEAVDTGLDWSTVIENESKNGVNLVPKSGNDATKSTASGAYDWFTNTWTVYDGSTWVGANSNYIAYYMDPRNFLNETDIFQFECLSYSSSQTKAGVDAILGDTFMAKTVKDTDKTTLNYSNAFLEIGKTTGVSPYHLASRVRQEQGLNGTSSLISGTYQDYEGYFNYFNVGASGVTSTLVIQNGLAYAKKAGWDTRYKSLLGGAQLLAKNYIAVGQDTLYFQKFNVVNTKNLYGHQYMANVAAAYNEGRKLGQGYSDKQQAFVFRIPVYTGMPESAVTFTASGNPNNYLKTLAVSGQSLTPTFRGSTTKYTVTVADTVTSVKVTATAVASTSTVTGTGTVTLTSDSTTRKVKCKSASGSTKTYTLTIVRQAAGEASEVPSSATYKVGDSYITGVAPGTAAADFLKEMTATNATMKLVNADGKAQTGTVATGNKLELYDKDNNKLSDYTIVIYGDVNGDGIIDALDMTRTNAYIRGQETLSGCYLEAANANRGSDGVNVLDLIYMNRHILGLITIQQ